jgi:lipoprotein-anchoring transpeptidase ErfK/SrfK
MRSLLQLLPLAAACAPDAGAAPAPVPTPPAPVEAAPAPAPAATYRTSARSLPVRTSPAPDAPLRGTTAEGGSFRVVRQVEGPGCEAGWAELEADGFLCLDGTEASTGAPVSFPPLVTFDPPDPSEFEHYLATGEYDHGQPEALVPAVYAKRWRRFKGQLYASLDAWNEGRPPIGQLEPGVGMKYRFREIVETEKGPVLTRDDGKVARLDDVYLYPVTRHHGRDLVADPVPAGQLPAFAIAYEGTAITSAPDETAAVVKTVPYHTPLVVEAEPADATGRWWRLADGSGYVNDWRGIRHPVASPGRPSGVGDDELWVDVELNQQALMVRKGDELVYFTIVSTGAAPMGTPKGTYRITGKYAWKDMASREGAEDVYYVEDVPWTMVFKPSYALHGAYWHWGFGRTASHGCVNLAPKDAAWLFAHLSPRLPDGWLTIFPTAEESTVVRIRRGDDAGADQRGPVDPLASAEAGPP